MKKINFFNAKEQLKTLHNAGLFHGDIQPGNIIVGDGGKTHLIDPAESDFNELYGKGHKTYPCPYTKDVQEIMEMDTKMLEAIEAFVSDVSRDPFTLDKLYDAKQAKSVKSFWFENCKFPDDAAGDDQELEEEPGAGAAGAASLHLTEVDEAELVKAAEESVKPKRQRIDPSPDTVLDALDA